MAGREGEEEVRKKETQYTGEEGISELSTISR